MILFRSNANYLILLFLSAFTGLSAQTIHSECIKNLRINGTADADFPVVLLDSYPITISFDVTDNKQENYRVKIYHCDRNWDKTNSTFINDDFKNASRNRIPFKEVPIGAKGYRWTYSIRIPEHPRNSNGMPDFEKLVYSGNYRFEIWDENLNEILAEGNFFAAEKKNDSALMIYNRYLPSEISPQNQVNKAELSFTLQGEKSDNSDPIYLNYIKAVDVYKNREIGISYSIDAENPGRNAYIEGYGTDEMKFVIDNLRPGNEYRRLDVSDPDLYPPGGIVSKHDGPDFVRWRFQDPPDMNGNSILVNDNQYAEYIQYRFELIGPEENVKGNIFVVGDFNLWQISKNWQLHYDNNTRRYTVLTSLRRGVYDYQYVSDGYDSIMLEGNDWRTVNVYTALLYYHDMHFGGFDRILLAAQRRSPGGSTETSR